ncbi:SRPBCC family protein [Sphingosinicella terrae]|uniref:SRPBCC family protein n=1 Tax=Sphingosinicella terrae TaxID=2172047 RepID=UPI000E0CCB6A|nr:SRPBCC domain-containing protein [Sphingosinicella terrae]
MIASLMALALAAEAPALRPGLEPLGFLVGHCWRGESASGEQDVHCFEPVFDGQHVRDTHEVTGGARAYRGETLYSAGADGTVSFTYWNSQGGVSRGTMRAGEGRLDFGDERYRGPDGREARFATHWRRIGDDAYEAVTTSEAMPSMNRTVRFERVEAPVTVSEARGLDGTHMLVHETVVDAPVEQVWAAIATPQGWREWAVPVAWHPEGEPDIIETSYSPGASPGDPSTIRQRILVAVPGRLVAFRTVKAPDGFPDFDSFSRTTGLFELEPEGGRTRLRLTGAGYPDSEAGRRLLGFFREGNRVSLERLRQRFVSGPVDWSRMRETNHGEEE